jgi:protease-4
MRRFAVVLGILVLAPVLTFQAAPAADDKPEKKADKTSKTDKKADKADKKAEPKPRIAVFRLKSSLKESPADDTFIFGTPPVSLKDLVIRLKKAKDDAAVKSVVILYEGGSAGSAQIEELRQAMQGVRDAGKDIYTHTDSLSLREYVLLSGASRISVVPTGDVWITGLYAEVPYLRGLLNLLGVEPDYLHCGAYKSASEIFMRYGPSPEAERMQNWLLDGLYQTYVDLIAKGRKVDAAKVRDWIDNGPYIAEQARQAGLIDAVEHREAFEQMLKDKYGKDVIFDHKYGQKKQPNVDFSSPFGFLKVWSDMLNESQKKKTGKNAVAIVYVEGAIVLQSNEGGMLLGGGEEAVAGKIRKALDDAAKDDSIKGVVLRVNSPGGSAVASEIMLNATRRVKAKKPFVVSMGDVAASGGYYVTCAADTVFADTATITGSIGVVGGKFATNGMWKKVGITFKSYQRGKNADLISTAKVFTPEQRERMQAWMDEIYGVFKQHVVDARGKRLKKPIDELAGGRVYTGKQALELGLVDKIGTLQDAINFVAAKANIKDYDIRVVPEPKNFLEQLIEESSGGKDNPHQLDATARRAPAAGTTLMELAMPYLKHLDPQRLAAVKQALGRLQLIQQEGAVLMMPEYILPR